MLNKGNGFFSDADGNLSMARLTTFVCMLGGAYNTAFIPFSDNADVCVTAALALFTIAVGGKAITKVTERK
jgi:hypothetical protein